MGRNRKIRATRRYRHQFRKRLNEELHAFPLIEIYLIQGKPIFIFESHELALLVWAYIKGVCFKRPWVFTLDHHQDTCDAFNRYLHQLGVGIGGYEKQKESMLDKIRIDNWGGTNAQLQHLNNDEHIDAAILGGVISACYCAQLSETDDDPEEGELTDGKTITLKPACYIGCEKQTHDDNCVRRMYDEVLESQFLDLMISQGDKCAELMGLPYFSSRQRSTEPFILDIDLDYFHSRRALSPANSETFYQLIQKAWAITIARESEWFMELCEEDELSPQHALASILKHIEAALSHSKRTCRKAFSGIKQKNYLKMELG